MHEVLERQPDFAQTVRGEFEKWYLPELVEQLMEGLRKAGLEVEAEASPVSQALSGRPTSGEQRADEGFWVAVLPFRFVITMSTVVPGEKPVPITMKVAPPAAVPDAPGVLMTVGVGLRAAVALWLSGLVRVSVASHPSPEG